MQYLLNQEETQKNRRRQSELQCVQSCVCHSKPLYALYHLINPYLLTSIVVHALTCLPNVGAFGPSVPQQPNLTYLKKLQCIITCIIYCNFLKEVRLGGWGLRGRRPRHQADTQVRALLYLGCVRYYTCVRHISACASIL